MATFRPPRLNSLCDIRGGYLSLVIFKSSSLSSLGFIDSGINPLLPHSLRSASSFAGTSSTGIVPLSSSCERMLIRMEKKTA